MKLRVISFGLILAACCLFSPHSVNAQTPNTQTYTTIAYDDATGIIFATGHTQADYQTGAYSQTTCVQSKIMNASGTQLALGRSEVQGLTADVQVQATGSANQAYNVATGHWLLTTYYVYNYYNNGYYQSGYYDPYNYSFYEGQGINVNFQFTFYGYGPVVIRYSGHEILGQTTATTTPLELKNTSTIVAAPENEDYASEKAAAGGTDQLGPLPMGDGRGETPGQSYTSPLMMIGTITPPSAYSSTYRWQRLITRRSWYVRLDSTGTKWVVTQRSSRGTTTPDDDTGDPAFNDPTPSSSTGKVYIYDNSALFLGTDNGDTNNKIGDFIREEKAFIYKLQRLQGTTWIDVATANVGQLIIVKRKATSGTVSSDWDGLENSTAKRTLDATISEAEVRAMVGGTLPIEIATNANN